MPIQKRPVKEIGYDLISVPAEKISLPKDGGRKIERVSAAETLEKILTKQVDPNYLSYFARLFTDIIYDMYDPDAGITNDLLPDEPLLLDESLSRLADDYAVCRTVPFLRLTEFIQNLRKMMYEQGIAPVSQDFTHARMMLKKFGQYAGDKLRPIDDRKKEILRRNIEELEESRQDIDSILGEEGNAAAEVINQQRFAPDDLSIEIEQSAALTTLKNASDALLNALNKAIPQLSRDRKKR